MTSTIQIESVEGLNAPAEILVDAWGVPHIRADSLDDLFFAQGFNAARDRLWQLDLWRKRGLGLLAADFGPGYLAQDYASRLFLYRGDMDAEWATYAPDAKDICTAFVAGINAYITLTEREPERLPPEFAQMGTKPARWEPEDVVRIRSHAMTRNILSEVLRTHVLTGADQATDDLRKVLEPSVVPTVPEGLDRSPVPLEVLTAYKLGTAAVMFSPERLAASLEEAWKWTKVTDLGDVVAEVGMQGSNNWVVDAAHTVTGRPLMASDPHRNHAVPALRYLVHLSAPGLDVIGAGEPVVPGVSIGHNGQIAFSLTIFYADQEDLYVYETKQGEPTGYRYEDSWQEMQVVEEVFAVKGAPDQVMALKFTRHGPVLFEQPERQKAYAVRSVWSTPGSAPYLRSLTSMRARTIAEFRDAMRGWGVPSSNHVFADVQGTIAWVPASWTPVRPNWDGLMPVPGDGRYEWDGFLDNEKLPRVVNPEKGFFATANEMNLPPDYPHAVGYEWIENSRTTRIHEVLHRSPQHSVDDACRLQTDVVSMPARRVCSLLDGLEADGDAAAALAYLKGWDHALAVDSGPAALFELWWAKHLKTGLLEALVPDDKLRWLLAPGDIEGILRALETPDERFGASPAAGRDALLRTTLAAAWRDCADRLGEDTSTWAWGRLHHALFEHSLASIEHGNEAFNIGPFPHGGSSVTPMHTGYRPSDFRTIAGASVRMVVDVGAWDESRWINAPGQSGDPRSPHYRDLAPIWAAGQYVPMLYSREAVDAAAPHRIRLEPQRASAPYVQAARAAGV
ncbi:penicillin acylase family protein [Microvirga sp. BT688]|uniref:penicillin acylase family protein n=1 Tax=Microvirga sp. TaxID=1873136 RepID=UPI001681FF9A|nr:penicillin acylase family protein [Microvirga sp.]MBD2749340.1 penicillin acylase family protein [Microvirga sp.]